MKHCNTPGTWQLIRPHQITQSMGLALLHTTDTAHQRPSKWPLTMHTALYNCMTTTMTVATWHWTTRSFRACTSTLQGQRSPPAPDPSSLQPCFQTACSRPSILHPLQADQPAQQWQKNGFYCGGKACYVQHPIIPKPSCTLQLAKMCERTGHFPQQLAFTGLVTGLSPNGCTQLSVPLPKLLYPSRNSPGAASRAQASTHPPMHASIHACVQTRATPQTSLPCTSSASLYACATRPCSAMPSRLNCSPAGFRGLHRHWLQVKPPSDRPPIPFRPSRAECQGWLYWGPGEPPRPPNPGDAARESFWMAGAASLMMKDAKERAVSAHETRERSGSEVGGVGRAVEKH